MGSALSWLDDGLEEGGIHDFWAQGGLGPLSLLPRSIPALHEVLSIMVGGERSTDGCEGVKRCWLGAKEWKEASWGSGELDRRQRQAQSVVTASWGEAAVRERVRERENWKREGKKSERSEKKKGQAEVF